MGYLFYNCIQLKKISLSTFKTKNVIDMSYMFYNCCNLNNLDLSSFDTKNVHNMSNMFFGCEKLHLLNLSSFDTKIVINMNKMFYCCKNLINLDLSSFDFRNVKEIEDIFTNCGRFNGADLSFLSDEIINYAFEYVVLFISGIKIKEKEDFLFRKLKSLKLFKEKGDIIKFKGKIILNKENKYYVLNLIKGNNNITDLKADCLILEYDVNDIKTLLI